VRTSRDKKAKTKNPGGQTKKESLLVRETGGNQTLGKKGSGKTSSRKIEGIARSVLKGGGERSRRIRAKKKG